MGWFSRKHKKEKQQTKTSPQPEGKPSETGEQSFGYTPSGQQGQYEGQYGSSQQRDQQPQMSRQQPETGYRSGGGYQTGDGGGGYGNPPYRSSSTGYNPAPDYGPSSGYQVPYGGYPSDTREGRNEPQYEKTGYQKRNERVESGRRGDDDYSQGTPGRYPDTPRTAGHDESGGGSSGGYRSRPAEGEGGGNRY